MMRKKHAGLVKSALITAAAIAALAACASFGFASEGGEAAGAHHVDTAKQMKDFVWRVVDFAVLFGILFWALRKADLKGALANRQATIEKALKEAEEARAAAELKAREYSEKLAKANQEVDEISAAIRKEGELEKQRIIAEAKATADKIKEQARQTAEQEVLKAKAELREEAARLAVQLAAQSLKENLKQDDQDRLVKEYLSKVVELH